MRGVPIVVVMMLVATSAAPARAQVATTQQLAKEAQIKDLMPYVTLRAEIPTLTIGDYNAAVRRVASQSPAPARTQMSTMRQLAKEAQIKALTPYVVLRAQIPALTVQGYNAAARRVATEALAGQPGGGAAGEKPNGPFVSSKIGNSPARTNEPAAFTFERFRFAPFGFDRFSTRTGRSPSETVPPKQ